MKRFIGAIAFLALAACATEPTVYGPSGANSETGYREMRIENERYRVTFRANADLKPPQVEDLAMRRAAEITLAQGYQWFNVVNRSTDLISGRSGGGTGVGIGGSSGSYGSSVGVGLSFDLSGDTRRYETVLEILLGRGEKPADPNAYNAQQVLARAP